MASNKKKILHDEMTEIVHTLDNNVLNLEETNGIEVDAGGVSGTGLNDANDTVVKYLLAYKGGIHANSDLPDDLKLDALQNMAYDSESEYAKRNKNRKEKYFAKFNIMYTIDGNEIDSKQISIRGAYIDFLPRP